MKHFLEKRNEEILQRDVKEKRMTKLDYNPTLASEDQFEALRPHSHLQHALPSSVYKVRLVLESVKRNANRCGGGSPLLIAQGIRLNSKTAANAYR